MLRGSLFCFLEYPVNLTAMIVPMVNDRIVFALNITLNVSYYYVQISLSTYTKHTHMHKHTNTCTHTLIGQHIMHKGVS